MKLSAYDPWGLTNTSRTSLMTLGIWVSFGWVAMIIIGLFFCLSYISANNRADQRGLPSTSITSWMTLSSMSPVIMMMKIKMTIMMTLRGRAHYPTPGQLEDMKSKITRERKPDGTYQYSVS